MWKAVENLPQIMEVAEREGRVQFNFIIKHLYGICIE
jgi:hypothetical protein